MGGMRKDLNDFHRVVQTCDYNVIVLVETWLNDTHLNSEIFGNSWQVFRNDRPGETRGGGVLIAVHNSLYSSQLWT